jgi:hypothetical protein
MNAVRWTLELELTGTGAVVALADIVVEPLTLGTGVRYRTTIDTDEEMFTAGFVRYSSIVFESFAEIVITVTVTEIVTSHLFARIYSNRKYCANRNGNEK